MSGSLPLRRNTQVRRRPVRRASRRISRLQVRALAALGICLVLGVALAAGPFFAVNRLDLRGARFTGEQAVRSIAGLDAGAGSAFALQTDRIASALVALPAVQRADVEVQLPSTLVVTLHEREPKLIWAIGSKRYVVDDTGLLFGEVDSAGRPIALETAPPPQPSSSPARPVSTATPTASRTPSKTPEPSSTHTPVPAPSLAPVPTSLAAPSLAAPSAGPADPSAGLDLPLVFDRLTEDAGLKVGDMVDPVWLDAAYRVAGLAPADVGSAAKRLVAVLDPSYGLTLTPLAGGWVADFGFYTATLRSPSVVPEQVRALRSLFMADATYATRLGVGTPIEAHVAWVWLMGDVPGGTNSFVKK